MPRVNEILERCTHLGAEEQELIQKAYIFAAAAHAGQVRLSGETYLSHPLAVANILAEMGLDAPSIAAGLLHDTVEDTKVETEDIDAQFGDQVGTIVDGVTKISQMQMTFDSKEAAQAENLRKMIMATSEDIRVLLVKLCDRLHNMRTLDFQKPHKRVLVAQETMDIYAPLANRLGMHIIKNELEDLSLKYIKPDIYEQIASGLSLYAERGKGYIESSTKIIEKKLKKNKITGRVSGRIKHIHSTWRKMETQGLTLDEVHDLIAFRIIVASVKDCYAVLGLVHAEWKPVPGRFKDYVSMPKANGYQSLHTTVVGPEGERMEIQIRTEEMHTLAEYGVAAHWSYKEKGAVSVEKNMERFSWLREMMDWQKHEYDSKEFLKSLQFDLFKSEVYVFTPNGDVKELPEGATAVDFAYLIHSEVGDTCAGARVNGRLVPLSRELINGDMVEIITDKKRRPSQDWLKFVKTAKARTRINQFIRTEERSRAIVLGRDMLEKEGRRMGINVAKMLKAGEFLPVVQHFSYKTTEDLLAGIGYSRMTPRQALNRLVAYLDKDEQREVREKQRKRAGAAEKKLAEKVSIRGVDDVLVRFAKCCNPVPGDAIIGYISRGKGVTVHTTSCPNVLGMEEERKLPISWEDDHSGPYPATIRVICKNIRGTLKAIGAVLEEAEVNVASGSFSTGVDNRTEMSLTIEVKDADHLYKTLTQINSLPAVLEAKRALGDKGLSCEG